MRNRLLRKILWRYYAFGFFRNLGFVSAVLVPFFTDWGHLSLSQVQLVQSWFMLCIFVLEIPTGVIADRFGRRTSLLVGSCLSVPAVLLYGSTTNLLVFLVCEALLAVGCACTSGAREAWMYNILRSCKQEHTAATIFARAQTWNLAGILLSAPIGSYLAATWGVQAPMLAWSVPFALSAVLALTLPEKNFAARAPKSYTIILRNAWTFGRAEPRFWRLVADLTLVSTAGYFVIWLYQPLLQSYGVSIALFGWYHVGLVAAQILITQTYNRQISYCRTRHSYLKVSAGLTLVGFGIAATVHHPAAVIVFIVIAGGFGLTRARIGDAYLAEFLPEAERASLLSGASMFGRLVLVIANPIIGYLSDYSIIWALSLLALLPLTALCLSPLRQVNIEAQPTN